MPPSTSISNTMSASVRPDCGRAVGSFGILTTIGRRLTASVLGASVPRSGQIAFVPAAALAAGAPDGPVDGAATVPPQATIEATESTTSQRTAPPLAADAPVGCRRAVRSPPRRDRDAGRDA